MRSSWSRIGGGISPRASLEVTPGAAVALWDGAPGGALGAGFAAIGSPNGIQGDPARWSLADASRVSGDFSLIVPRADGLLLARGRFGGRPLYYARGPDRSVLACSQLAPLVRALEITGLCTERLAATLLLGTCADLSLTPYRGIHRVPTGEALEVFSDGRVRRAAVPLAIPPALEGSADEIAEELRAVLGRVLARLVRGRRRIAVLTGGGVDSSGLLALLVAHARGANGPEVEALALDFATHGDDRPYLRALSDAIGVVPIRLGPAACAHRFREACVLDAAPCAWPQLPWDYEFARLARERGADAIVSGIGGDELFDGDGATYAELALRGDWLGAVRGALTLRSYVETTPWQRVRFHLLGPIARLVLPEDLVRLRHRRARARGSALIRSWAGPALRRALDADVSDARAAAPGASMAARVQELSRAPFLLDTSDMVGQLESATGCTNLSPFYDEELATFAARIPAPLLLHGGRVRGLFRHAMRGVVPDVVRLRPDKASFEPAFAEVLRAMGGAPALADLLEMKGLEALGLVEAARFREAFLAFAADDERQRTSPDWTALWPALAVESFVSNRRLGPADRLQ